MMGWNLPSSNFLTIPFFPNSLSLVFIPATIKENKTVQNNLNPSLFGNFLKKSKRSNIEGQTSSIKIGKFKLKLGKEMLDNSWILNERI